MCAYVAIKSFLSVKIQYQYYCILIVQAFQGKLPIFILPAVCAHHNQKSTACDSLASR